MASPDFAALARVVHVLAVVLWIGGVAFVTLVLLPSLRASRHAGERLALFESLEGRFALQSKITTALVGITGFYMVEDLGAWSRFLEPRFWWMHAMVAVWLVFTFVLFVAEPLFLHRWFRARAAREPESTFGLVLAFHRALLALSIVTIGGAVAGSHGWLPW
jgi:uncharacterized membrane protein